MIDQMKEYNRETSQIHAPADLIRRTKEAVREEEQRLERQRLQQSVAVQPKHSYGKVYRWALPVAAAAVCLILLNVSGMILGRGISKSQLESAADTASGAAPASDSDTGMRSETTDWAESAAVADEPIEEEDRNFDMAEAETATDAVPAENYAKVQSADAGAAEGYEKDQSADAAPAEDAARSDAAYENGMEDSYIKSIYGRDLWIEEVEEVPSAYFYANTDTESIIINGTVLYVAQDLDDTWIAYVKIDGQKYVVRGELTEEDISSEEFAEKAYKLLEDCNLFQS